MSSPTVRAAAIRQALASPALSGQAAPTPTLEELELVARYVRGEVLLNYILELRQSMQWLETLLAQPSVTATALLAPAGS